MNRRKTLLASVLCCVAAGVFYLTPFSNTPPPTKDRGDRVSYYSNDLDFAGVKSLPALQNDTTVWVWSVYNDDAISFFVEKRDSDSFQIMLADLDNPETFYQLAIHPESDEVNVYKYVGGLWDNKDGFITRTSLFRVLWEEIEQVKIVTSPTTISLNIPWSSIRGITPTDRIGIQIVEGSGANLAWDSRDEKTSFLDRRSWNELRIEK